MPLPPFVALLRRTDGRSITSLAGEPQQEPGGCRGGDACAAQNPGVQLQAQQHEDDCPDGEHGRDGDASVRKRDGDRSRKIWFAPSQDDD